MHDDRRYTKIRTNTNDEIKCNVIVTIGSQRKHESLRNMKLLASHRVLTVVEKVPLSSRHNHVSK